MFRRFFEYIANGEDVISGLVVISSIAVSLITLVTVAIA